MLASSRYLIFKIQAKQLPVSSKHVSEDALADH